MPIWNEIGNIYALIVRLLFKVEEGNKKIRNNINLWYVKNVIQKIHKS